MISTLAPDFAAALPDGGRLAGLDVGTKTIGVALCDAGWSFATPTGRFAAASSPPISTPCAGSSPRSRSSASSSGCRSTWTAATVRALQSVRAFARNLAPLGLPVLLWDERWSTAAVERAMIAADVSRAKRAERIDSAAAAFILQGAIDALVRA